MNFDSALKHMSVESMLVGAAQFLGTHGLACFFAALLMLLLAVSLLRWRLLRYPLLMESGEHSPAVLALRFALGFILIVLATVLFIGISDEIGVDEELARFDLTLADAIRQNIPSPALQVFAWITHFGDTATFIGLGFVIAIMLLVRREFWLAAGWIIAVAGNSILNKTLKAVFERMRPLGDHGVALTEGWSFPSGHSSGSVVVYGMLSYILIRHTSQAWHLPILLLAVAIAFSTGCSRVFLHYHYASDVIAGFASGAAWLAVCISTIELGRWYRRHKRRNNLKN